MLQRIAFLLCLLAAPALAQSPPAAPAPAPIAKPATVRVALETAAGTITVEIETERAPITAANFLRYVDQKRYDGTAFYRADPVAPNFGLIQGGTRNDPKRTLKPIPHEPTTKTGLSNTDGAISMARGAPGTATSDFFIIIGDMSGLDAKPDQPGDNLGFAAFGHVVDGMDVVHKILASPTSPTAGEGVMKGQMLEPKITILHARRVI
ncbi:peptidylprolyl isomerase [Sphingomonas crusticola]|uniref:peptidylprolyl isomerase n=1 Tax=Sphingomonas crusticola TaxID=1697973 RepID=UPI000E2601DB|nr:peptidylprolyl isomerase [Sphingomonas crusticola]